MRAVTLLSWESLLSVRVKGKKTLTFNGCTGASVLDRIHTEIGDWKINF
jgi:hypothetical protein